MKVDITELTTSSLIRTVQQDHVSFDDEDFGNKIKKKEKNLNLSSPWAVKKECSKGDLYSLLFSMTLFL